MDYHHKSGSQKRKEKATRHAESARGQTSLARWGFNATSQNRDEGGNSSQATTPASGGEDAAVSQDECVRDPDEGGTRSNPGAENPTEIPPEDSVPVQSGETTRSTSANPEVEKNTETPEEDFVPVQSTKTKVQNVDIGTYEEEKFTSEQTEDILRRGHEPFPKDLPSDSSGHNFIHSILKKKMQNGQVIDRDWMVWSRSKQALYCLPCRLFCELPQASRSLLASPSGFSKVMLWRKLYNKLPDHESCADHKKNYIKWREVERRIEDNSTVSELLSTSILSEAAIWRQILQRLLHVTLFLSERGLAFRGDSSKIGDSSNGNFLGMLEVIARYDAVLAVHLQKVKESQDSGTRMQAHYLSGETQNEFISCCADEVLRYILAEREKAKYFSIMVDATPDSAHIEQTVFILRYLIEIYGEGEVVNKYEPVERFLAFVDCDKKTGEDIGKLILSTLEKKNIGIDDCRGQGYDNGSNMSGKYKGAQAYVIQANPLALFCPCGCHSLNLVGVHAAESCTCAITFFGTVQNLYNIFSGSTQRWKILEKAIGASLHSLSDTRWSARVAAVKPFAAHLPGLIQAVEEVLSLNLTAETKASLLGILKYLKSFECILMASTWFKVLSAIDQRNVVLQARSATLDVELENVESLLEEMKTLRDDGWPKILDECTLVYRAMQPPLPPSSDATASAATGSTPIAPKRRRTAKRFADEPPSVDPMANKSAEETFAINTYYVLLDAVIGGLSTRYDRIRNIVELYRFLWEYLNMNQEELRKLSNDFQEMYNADVGPELTEEIFHLKAIHRANLGPEPLPPLKLLNRIKSLNLESLFPNVCVALKLFCTLPVTVAGNERSFSTLSRVKSVFRSTMCQDRLNSLGVLCVESGIARKVDLDVVINDFAQRKARKKNF